jgi:phosphoribosylamine---glycine ligase
MNKVMVIDATGRGHAICDLFVRTNSRVVVYYAPGCELVDHSRIRSVQEISLTDVGTVISFLQNNPVDFVFVSNIDALCRGYVDAISAAGWPVIGPDAAAATLEASKVRGREFCTAHGLPIPPYRAFHGSAAASEFIRHRPEGPCVVKANGLTADGDAAIVCETRAAALDAVSTLSAAHGREELMLVEELVTGTEISVFALLDGTSALLFPPAMDYKRALVGDRGKNCDGMGSIAPHPAESPELRAQLKRTLVEPLVRGIAAENLRFTGFVYIGAMLTVNGLVVLEINARFGDSEAEVILPGLTSDFAALCHAVLAGGLSAESVSTDGLARCSVALVQGAVSGDDPRLRPGWPHGKFAVGQPVAGLSAFVPGTQVFCAGVRRDDLGQPVTAGGRVLHVVGAGVAPELARERAYRRAAQISFAGISYRSDIGLTGAVLRAAKP